MHFPYLKRCQEIFTYIFFFILIFQSDHLLSQNKVLKIRLVSHDASVEEDCEFLKMMEAIIIETPLRERYNRIHFDKSEYYDSGKDLDEDVIQSFTPTKFITTKAKLESGSIIPIFVVQKNGSDHFSCYLVTSKNSVILDLEHDFKKIKKFYFVDEYSTSGYTKPLELLEKLELIKEPCACGITTSYRSVEILGKHIKAINRLETTGEEYSVAATYSPDTTKVRRLYTYEKDNVIQDAIFISKNLNDYKDSIMDWFLKAVSDPSRKKIFEKSSQKITGLTPYQEATHGKEYAALLKLKNRVDECVARDCKKSIFGEFFTEVKNDFVVHLIFFVLTITTGYYIGRKKAKKKPSVGRMKKPTVN